MSSEERDQLLDHEYDGIREYDNPTPGWMHFIFWSTVVFSAGYFFFFHISPVSWSVASRYDEAVASDLRARFSEIGELEPTAETIVRYMDEEDWLKVGEGVFKGQCASCHAQDGSGLVGPNLTDDHYKNVREIEDIARIVEEGAAGGAMPAWKNRLHPNEIVLVSSYVASLRGKDLPSAGGRPAEGSVIPPWPELSELTSSEKSSSKGSSPEDPAAEENAPKESSANESSSTKSASQESSPGGDGN